MENKVRLVTVEEEDEEMSHLADCPWVLPSAGI
jgi:hypothetical protein